jgi:flagellar motor switch protein FliN/FliY
VPDKNEMPSGAGMPAAREPRKAASMEMMLDIELPVRISLAKAVVPLREILKLSTGSVLELNRSLDDAADIVVNNRVVAQGEIVVVEGNYGIRIQRVNDQARHAASQAKN